MRLRPIFFICLLATCVIGQKPMIELPGVRILQTTRKEIEKKYGPPLDENKSNNSFKYNTEDLRIEVRYTSKPCSGGTIGAYNVKENRVLDYSIRWRRRTLLSELGVDLSSYYKDDSGDVANLSTYIDRGHGSSIEVGETVGGLPRQVFVTEIVRLPSQKEEKGRKCRANRN